jgi:hypothetical protein
LEKHTVAEFRITFIWLLKGYSKIDAMFAINTLVEHYLNHTKGLYVDLKNVLIPFTGMHYGLNCIAQIYKGEL